jgi:hypothetical protein
MDDAFEFQRVVGCGDTQVVVTNTFFFLRNCRVVIADEVQSIRKTVLIDTCKVLFDKVLLTGRLRKEVAFRESPLCPGNVAPLDLARAEVDFQAVIDVRGAQPGDTCVVVKAFVEGEEEKPLPHKPRGIKGLLDSSVLFLCVRVRRASVLEKHDHRCDDRSDSGSCDDDWRHEWDGDVFGHSGSFGVFSDSEDVCSQSVSGKRHHKKRDRSCRRCARRRTTGLVTGGSDGVPDAQPGLVPGSFVGPTILFPGVS